MIDFYDKKTVDPRILAYLKEQTLANFSLAERATLKEKSNEKLSEYIYKKAQDLCKEGSHCVCVDDETVFGWAVEYLQKKEYTPKGDFLSEMEAIQKEEDKKSLAKKKKSAKPKTDAAEAKADAGTDVKAEKSAAETEKVTHAEDLFISGRADAKPDKPEAEKADVSAPEKTASPEPAADKVIPMPEKKEEKKISIFDIPDIDGQESIFDIFKNL